jgi:hypothetical protein
MTYILNTHNNVLDLATEESKRATAQALFAVVKQTSCFTGASPSRQWFDFSNYGFERNANSGLTRKGGFYLMVHKVDRKFYFGSTATLAARKATHKRNVVHPEYVSSLARALRGIQIADFTFIPVVAFEISNVVGLVASPSNTLNQQIQRFLESSVESPLLGEFFADGLCCVVLCCVVLCCIARVCIMSPFLAVINLVMNGVVKAQGVSQLKLCSFKDILGRALAPLPFV